MAATASCVGLEVVYCSLPENMHTFFQRAVNRDGTSENAVDLDKVCNGGSF